MTPIMGVEVVRVMEIWRIKWRRDKMWVMDAIVDELKVLEVEEFVGFTGKDWWVLWVL